MKLGSNSTPHELPRINTRQLVMSALTSYGPLRSFDLQRLVKIRKSRFLVALKALKASGEVFSRGRGVKGSPLIYTLAPKPIVIETSKRKSRLIIV